MPDHDIVLSAQWTYVDPGSNPDPTPVTPITPVVPTPTPDPDENTPTTPTVTPPSGGTTTPEPEQEPDSILDDGDTPAAQSPFQRMGVWSLLNLIMSILAVMMIVREITKNVSKKYESAKIWNKAFTVLTYIVGIAIPILFIAGSNIRNEMVWVDHLTIPLTILFVLEVVFLLTSTKKVDEDDLRAEGIDYID